MTYTLIYIGFLSFFIIAAVIGDWILARERDHDKKTN